MRQALLPVRDRYDYILVDTPPVIGSVDVNMIADNVDGVLFTAILLKSKKGPLKKAIEQVMPANVLGVVTLGV
jgi:Mrp family chromosome partitioning ATPase